MTAKPANQRQTKKRLLDKANKVLRKEFTWSETEKAMLGEICKFRGGYDAGEAMRFLIRNEYAKVLAEKPTIEPCRQCGKVWPASCNKELKVLPNCFMKYGLKALAL